MTLENFLNDVDKFKLPSLQSGEVSTIKELFERIIFQNIPTVKTIIGWHNLLLEYVEQEDAIFFIRRYASATDKQWDLIRRGFLTEYASGFRYVFCDNFFAHYFYIMALHDFIPTIDEFSKLIKSRKFPYGYMKTSEEESFQAFPKGKIVKLNSAGWKLAHIYSVNQNDYTFDYKGICKFLYPRGLQEDWKVQKGNDYPSRFINETHTDELKKITIAHFLRLVHPINYFLVPKTKLSTFDIGEAKEVISFMRNVYFDRFGKILLDYEELIKSDRMAMDVDGSSIFNVRFGFDIQKISNGISLIKPLNNKSLNSFIVERNDIPKNQIKENINVFEQKYSDVDLKIIKAYLIDGLSFRTIEKEILKIDSQVRGGGFVAKKILNSYGIEAKNKGTITRYNIGSVINNCGGLYLKTLTHLKEKIDNK